MVLDILPSSNWHMVGYGGLLIKASIAFTATAKDSQKVMALLLPDMDYLTRDEAIRGAVYHKNVLMLNMVLADVPSDFVCKPSALAGALLNLSQQVEVVQKLWSISRPLEMITRDITAEEKIILVTAAQDLWSEADLTALLATHANEPWVARCPLLCAHQEKQALLQGLSERTVKPTAPPTVKKM